MIALVLVGLASAQIGAYQYSTTNPTAAPNPGFRGWIGNYLGYTSNQPYANQYPADQHLLISQVPLPTNLIKVALDKAMAHVGQDSKRNLALRDLLFPF